MVRKINLSVLLFLIFLACSIWLVLLTQGLPIGDPDDWDHVLAAMDLPWKTLLSRLITPWSQSLIWSGQINRMNEVLNQRLFRSIVLKIIQNSFGFHFFPYYLFSKIIFFSGTVTLLFYLISKLTRSYWVAFAATFFYAMIPAHYSHVLWLSDPETMVQFWMILSLFFFMRFLKFSKEQNQANKELLWFFLFAWLAMKTKESALVLPISIGIFSFFEFIKQKGLKKEFLICVLICFFLTFLIVPILGLSLTNKPPCSFKLETLSRLVFRNYNCGYDNEPSSAFFSLRHIWPVSIARSFGFYLLWTLVVFGFFYFGKRPQSNPLLIDFQKRALLQISVLWILIWALFVTSFQPDPRYFSSVMIPITILTAYFSQRVIQSWRDRVKIGLICLVILALGSNIFENVQHVISLRMQIGQRVNRFLNLAKIIFEGQYGVKNVSEIARYYSAEYIQNPNQQPRIENVTYHVDMDYGPWNRSEHPTANEFEICAKKGFPYYVTYNHHLLETNSHIQLLKTISGINENSLIEQLTYRLKRKIPQPLYVLKWIS